MDHFIKNHQNLSKNERVLGTDESQNERSKEQGRSMVEMLGVLAIVGVLSIGAISGYRYAMNKYRANQVTNELNLMSHQVAIAMMSKNGLTGTLNLGESYDTNKKLMSSGYDIAFGCGDSGDDTECSGQNAFHFEVKNVSEGVCKELETMGEHLQYLESLAINAGAGCQSGSENSVSFVFASSDFMSEEKLSPEDVGYCNSHGKYNTATGSCSCKEGFTGYFCQRDKRCSGNGTYREDWSDAPDGGFECDCMAGYTGINCQTPVCNGHGTADNYGKCTCEGGYSGPNCECDEGEQWDGLQCVTSCPEGGCVQQECDNDNPCPAGQYCYYTSGKNCTDEFGTGASAQKGQCRSVEADSYTFGKYVASKVTMNWWSAERFCSALGKDLIEVEDLDCKHTFCKNGCDASGWGYCHNKNDETAGATDRIGRSLNAWSPTLWALRKKLYEEEGYYAIWTGSNYDSCRAYFVRLIDGHVNYYNRYYGGQIAVCK